MTTKTFEIAAFADGDRGGNPAGVVLTHARNAFASGGVREDPATGAAAAALGGLLRDLGWRLEQPLVVRQGDDMGAPSKLIVEPTKGKGAPVNVTGRARFMRASEL
ncbi:MAG: PhzF family phenazine biosynthesis protein [Rhodothalassiaceae bacterium]